MSSRGVPDATVVLGDEHDPAVRQAVLWALETLGAERDGGWDGMAGSQEISHLEFRIGGDWLVLEAETYVGLSLSGPAALVARLARLTEQRLG